MERTDGKNGSINGDGALKHPAAPNGLGETQATGDQKATDKLASTTSSQGIPRPRVHGDDHGHPEPNRDRDRGRASHVKRAIQQAQETLGGAFDPDGGLSLDIAETLYPEAMTEVLQMQRAKDVAPAAGWFMKCLRATGRKVDHWAVNVCSQLVGDHFMGNPPSSWKTLAHRSGVAVSDWEAIVEKAHPDNFVLLAASIHPVMLKEMGIPMTPKIMGQVDDFIAQMNNAGRKLSKVQNIPWLDNEIQAAFDETKR